VPSCLVQIEQHRHAIDGHHSPSCLLTRGGKKHYEHKTHLYISFSGTVLRLVTKVRRCALFNEQKLHSYVQPHVCSERETHNYTWPALPSRESTDYQFTPLVVLASTELCFECGSCLYWFSSLSWHDMTWHELYSCTERERWGRGGKLQ